MPPHCPPAPPPATKPRHEPANVLQPHPRPHHAALIEEFKPIPQIVRIRLDRVRGALHRVQMRQEPLNRLHHHRIPIDQRPRLGIAERHHYRLDA